MFGGGYFNSHLILLEIVVGFRTVVDYAKDFSKNTGQFKGVTRETIYHVSIAELLTRNLKSQITKLVGRLKTYHLLYFSGDNQFLQNSPGKKSLYYRSRKCFIHWPGSCNLVPGRQLQQNYLPGN